MAEEPSTEMIRGTHLSLRKRGRWEFVSRPNCTGVVAIVALTELDELVLIEQYRPAVGHPVLEIPAGLVGDEQGLGNEQQLSAACRELKEETGYIASSWTKVAEGPPSAGLSDEVVAFFMARDLARSGSGGGVGDEQITVHLTTRDGLVGLIAQFQSCGGLVDPKVFAAAWFAWGAQR